MQRVGFLVGVVALIFSTACIQIQRVHTEGEVEIREILIDSSQPQVKPAVSEKVAPLPVPSAKGEASAKVNVEKQNVASVESRQKKESTSLTPVKKPIRRSGVCATNRNRVIITCPSTLKRLIVERANKNGVMNRFSVMPGKGVVVYAQTPYLDQLLVLVVHGYKHDERAKDKEVYVGRATKQYGGTEFVCSGHTVFWNVSTGELLQ